jgi:ribosomal protein S18 acetylase RimI-like enzyme
MNHAADSMSIAYTWRGDFSNEALNRLHAEAFVLDTIVASTHRRLGIATRMLALCASEARKARCEWLHVDFEEHLCPLYFESAGFTPTRAGLIKL